MALVATTESFVTHKLIGGVYTWENLGDGSLFDLHESYVTYTDLEKTKTGICFNAGDDRPLVKYVPALVDVWITLDYYNAGQWRWVQVFLNGDKKIGINGTDNDTFFRFYTDEYAGKEGINTLQLHFNVIENIAEIWINGTKGAVVSNAKLSSPITSISFSPSGWASNYAKHTSNAMSNITIKGTIIEVDETLPEGAGGWVNTYFTHIPHNGLDVRAVTPYITTRKAVDEATPEGISGWVNAYITCIPHIGMDINELNVYATYRRDDKVDLTEGMDDAQITGYMSAYATYKPHDGLDVLGSFAYITYRSKEYTSDVVFCGDEFLNENTMKNGGVLLNGENHWVTMLSRYMDKSYVNTSLEGDEIANIKNSLDDRIFQYKPTHVFIEGGTNDCINGATAEVTQENMRDVIQKLLEKDIQVALVWLPVNKSQSSELDVLLEKYKQIADEFSVTHPAYFRFLNLEGIADNEEYIDDFHLYQAGHKAITEGILTVIGTMPSYMKNKYAIYSAPMYPLRFMFPY